MCFASSKNIYIAHKDGAMLRTAIPAGGVGDGYELAGVVAGDEKIYALGKPSGAETGVISSASLYYVRII